MRREIVVIFIGLIITLGALGGIGYYLSLRQSVAKADEVIDLAASFAEDGEWARMTEVLEPYTEEAPRAAQRDEIWSLLAQAHTELGHQAQAVSFWERLAESAESSSLRAESHLELAELAVEQGDEEMAEEHLAAIRAEGASEFTANTLYIEALIAESRGEFEQAREILSEIRREHPDAQSIETVEEKLSALNLERLLSGRPDDNDIIYTIEAGDTLWDLGREHGVSPDLISRVNGINPNSMRQGRRIKIPINDFSIEVYKEDFLVYVFDEGEFFCRYPCRVGREDYMTPEGEFHIEARQQNPTWNDPRTGRTIPAGDPENELGTRWLGFRENPSIGIHGTIHPESIGTNSSSGCIGLVREDVEQLYDMIPRGTPVTVYGSREEARRGRGSGG